MQNKGPGKLNKRFLCCIIKVTSKSLIFSINRGKKLFSDSFSQDIVIKYIFRDEKYQ